VEDPHEQGNEPLGPIEDGNFLLTS